MLFSAEHDLFRTTIRDFVQSELDPHIDAWEAAGSFPAHDVLGRCAELGLLGLEYDPEWGGQGADHSFTVVLHEELGRIAGLGVPMAISVQTDMATPSLHQHGTDEQRRAFLAPALRGEAVAAIAVTEPDAGSDVAGLSTRAARDGDEWVINGTKLYITNGVQADWLCVLARTSDEGGHNGISQIIVPGDAPGFGVSRKLDKLGMRSSDTAELSFVDCRVPVANTIGETGRGFHQQMGQFQQERMALCYQAVGSMDLALERTRRYLTERRAFGAPLADHQYLRFELAELAAEVDLLRHYNHACAARFVAGEDTTRMVSIAKFKAGRLMREVSDVCLQFHGGIGYMEETWPARYFRDARLTSIGGGADEIMLQTIDRLDMGALGPTGN